MTQDPRVVLPLQWEELVESESVDLQLVFNSMTKQIQNLLVQRDSFLEVAHLKGTLFHIGEYAEVPLSHSAFIQSNAYRA